MLVPNPQVLRDVLNRRAAAQQAYDASPDEANRLALENVSYTLCVITATTGVPEALAAAELLLAHPTVQHRKQDTEALAA
ncbi:DUF5133 domain-containing protein [Streptomyces sp. NPDC091272]|uniref:DUF5133 domain-containing protein n=1 Tax=Streptomyces sp. NPDC091272 TaxID=3365981 RepID=UPI00382A0916